LIVSVVGNALLPALDLLLVILAEVFAEGYVELLDIFVFFSILD